MRNGIKNTYITQSVINLLAIGLMGKFENEFLWRKKVKQIACLKAFNAQIFNPIL